MQAVAQNGKSLQWASEEIKKDKDFVLYMVTHTPYEESLMRCQ
jgi:hypothetical protein